MDTLTAKIKIRGVSNPPAQPINEQTGRVPAFYAGSHMGLKLGFFTADGAPMDLSDIRTLSAVIYPIKTRPNPFDAYYPTQPDCDVYRATYGANKPYPLLSKTLSGDQIDKIITSAGWINGTEANCIFNFDYSETQLLNPLDNTKRVWLEIQGVSNTGIKTIYTAGEIEIYKNQSMVDTLLSDRTPLFIPENTRWYIPPNEQKLFDYPIVVDGQIVVDGLLIHV